MPSVPRAESRPQIRSHHGDDVVDEFEWLRDKDDPAVIDYLTAENDHTDAETAHLAGLRETIFEEIKSRTQETDLSVPVREGEWWYYSRSFEGKQYGVHCRAPITGPDDWTPPTLDPGVGATEKRVPGEQIVLDDNVEAAGHEFYSLGSFDVSEDGRLLLYAVDTVGDERYTLRVRDLETGEDLADEVPGTFPGALFSPDGRYLYYPTVDDAWRPDTIWRHELGQPASEDVAVFTEPDDRYWVGVGMTRSRRYLVIDIGSKITSETLLLDADDPTGEFAVVWPRREGVEYSVEHVVVDGEDRLLVLHNDGALDFELVEVDPHAPGTGPSGAHVVVPAHDGLRLEDVDAFERFLVLEYRHEGLTRVAVVPNAALSRPAGTVQADTTLDPREFEIAFDEPLFQVGARGNPEWTQPTLRLGYGSFVTPSTVIDYAVDSGERTVLKRQPVLGDYDPQRYEQRREWATASDGTRVPVSLVFRRDLVSPGIPAPLELYGYGSYETSIDPAFSIARLSLLDRGVVFAIAHVRGGGELGRAWYENGKTLTKKNTFTDFVAVADHLIAGGWTTSERMVAEGGSAGGLLMGAVANLAPQTFAGILASVPFVDALTSILDPSLPLTVIEWDEWGDPLHDAEVYAYMKSYSPYENVREDAAYPRILAVTSLNDTRVLYVEPAKWTARLRQVNAPVLLKTEMQAGHGGVSGRYDSWRERAYELAWMLDVLGLA
ncbi:S9 family peptidase [Compostimonas suwonensis]|uniref:Oligopeptidase B n=1 Tax=Compostimonas suwonensis TaxID=1048394 RepID=A0A2M9BU49_9MICO|nr:S9 family peptidase [Compostimonas suwonensis]PJJ61469.1 oligopeptidase B [Compostimonas suwonensis]